MCTPSSSSGTAELKEYERKNVIQIVPMSVTSDEFQGIYSVLGQVHAADDSVDELKEAVRVSEGVGGVSEGGEEQGCGWCEWGWGGARVWMV